MKKLFIGLLASFAAFGLLTGCDSASSDHKSGETVETDLYAITLNETKFSDNILVGYGEGYKKSDIINYSTKEEFFTATDDPFVDEDGYVIKGIHGFSSSKDSENTYLWYDFEFQYIGKEEDEFADYNLAPKVYYKDYTFDSDYISMYRTKTDEEISAWNNFDVDFGTFGFNNLSYFNGRLEPLTQKTYEIRGIIPVPKNVAEDKDEKVVLSIYGVRFVVN